jgi:D-methionine transport system permease protein
MYTELLQAFKETVLMIGGAGFSCIFIALPWALLLTLTAPCYSTNYSAVHRSLSTLVSLLTYIPSVLWVAILIPVTIWILNNQYDPLWTIIPLTAATLPSAILCLFQAFSAVPKASVQAARQLGASTPQLLRYVFFPEAHNALLQAMCKILSLVLSASVVAGLLGSGGLGKLILEQAYQQAQWQPVILSTLLIVAINTLLKKGYKNSVSLAALPASSRGAF